MYIPGCGELQALIARVLSEYFLSGVVQGPCITADPILVSNWSLDFTS